MRKKLFLSNIQLSKRIVISQVEEKFHYLASHVDSHARFTRSLNWKNSDENLHVLLVNIRIIVIRHAQEKAIRLRLLRYDYFVDGAKLWMIKKFLLDIHFFGEFLFFFFFAVTFCRVDWCNPNEWKVIDDILWQIFKKKKKPIITYACVISVLWVFKNNNLHVEYIELYWKYKRLAILISTYIDYVLFL